MTEKDKELKRKQLIMKMGAWLNNVERIYKWEPFECLKAYFRIDPYKELRDEIF